MHLHALTISYQTPLLYSIILNYIWIILLQGDEEKLHCTKLQLEMAPAISKFVHKKGLRIDAKNDGPLNVKINQDLDIFLMVMFNLFIYLSFIYDCMASTYRFTNIIRFLKIPISNRSWLVKLFIGTFILDEK